MLLYNTIVSEAKAVVVTVSLPVEIHYEGLHRVVLLPVSLMH